MDAIKQLIFDSIAVKQQLLADETLLQTVQEVAALLVDRLRAGNRLWFCGNGGSAADAQHLAAEFSGRFYKDREALPAEALHVNTSYLTAVANDYGFDDVYARMVRGVAKRGDVLLGFSTSGNSANVVKAVEAARAKGVATVAFTGLTGGLLRGLCDHLINVPSADTPRIQEAHILLGHVLCQLVEAAYFDGQKSGGMSQP